MNNFNIAQTAKQKSRQKIRPKRRRFYDIYRKNVKKNKANGIAKINEIPERLALYQKP